MQRDALRLPGTRRSPEDQHPLMRTDTHEVRQCGGKLDVLVHTDLSLREVREEARQTHNTSIRDEGDDVTVSDAYEILTLANALGYEERLTITEARAGAGGDVARESALRAARAFR